MAANTQPIYSLTPNVGLALIPTANAQVKSDGTTAGSANDVMICAFISGTNGSFVQRLRFSAVSSTAATNTTATTLRMYLSTVSAAIGVAVGATTSSNTFLLAEVSVPIISSSHSTNATNFYEVPLNIAIPTGRYIHVSQHLAQTSCNWNVKVFGGDY